MTKDLEATIAELGPEYRSVVARLRAPFAPSSSWRRPSYLLAASLLIVLGLAVWTLSLPTDSPSEQVARSAPVDYIAAYVSDGDALQAIRASQRCDGSWSNDYLTMQNAAALRRADDECSRIAYKRAVRYLRAKGLSPITDAELDRRSGLRLIDGHLPKSAGILI